MQTREQLQDRVAELERRLAGLGAQPRWRGIRRRSSRSIGALPLYDIAIGPDVERGEVRGHARGVIAIGDIATGWVAFGGLARGALAAGGLAIGLIGFGGLSVAPLLAVGGLAVGGAALGGAAIGGVAVGGGAVGGVAIGGGAVGYYACGGGAAGAHVVDAKHRDPAAEQFLREYGVTACSHR